MPRYPARPCRAEVGNLARSIRHHGRVPEVDDDQLAALRRLRAAFGPIVVVEVVSTDPGDDLAAQGEPIRGAGMADPRRMTPQEQGEAHTLLVEAVSDPDWQAARQALDELMRKLLVVHRLLEAEERLAPARAASRANVTAAGAQAFRLVPVQECGRCPARPPAGAARSRL
jgi:hypothetical protein